jgi:UDP-3-O-[3-hydroxymyristoyl] glucosamine N-acyltransferase
MAKTAAEIAELVSGRILGDRARRIDDAASIENVQSDCLVWADSEKNLSRALHSGAAAIILSERTASKMSVETTAVLDSKTLILVDNPRLAFAKVVALFHPMEPINRGIHPTAQIAEGAQLGERVSVGPYSVIEDHAVIGAGTEVGAHVFIGKRTRVGESCRLYPSVVLYHDVTLGAQCVIHSGAVIGSDGFGFVPHDGRYHKFPQVGTVLIGDDVEIGANTTIDRGALDATRIGRGTKIDNLVQIAHNVEIGEDVVIAAQTGISGGTVVEDHCVIGGQVGMGDHVRVKRGAVVGSKGGILPGKIIREGQVVWGIPAIPLDEYKVLNALWRSLPKMKEEIERLKNASTEGQEKKSQS